MVPPIGPVKERVWTRGNGGIVVGIAGHEEIPIRFIDDQRHAAFPGEICKLVDQRRRVGGARGIVGRDEDDGLGGFALRGIEERACGRGGGEEGCVGGEGEWQGRDVENLKGHEHVEVLRVAGRCQRARTRRSEWANWVEQEKMDVPMAPARSTCRPTRTGPT